MIDTAQRAAAANDPQDQDVPLAIQQKRWSAFLVPLIWSASSMADSHPVLDWLAAAAQLAGVRINISGHDLEGAQATREAWRCLRSVMRQWGVHSPQELADWIRQQGLPEARPNNYFIDASQE